MDAIQRGNDAGDDFAGLDYDDYGNAGDDYGHDSGAALDFDEYGYDSPEQSAVDALDAVEPAEPATTGTELGAIDALAEDVGASEDRNATDDESSPGMATVTSPTEAVSVTAIMGGGIHSVELTADAGWMTGTESELAEEILVIADLASQKAASVLHSMVTETAEARGLGDHELLSDLLAPGFLDLPSPKQALEAQAEVFATRYADGHR